LEALSRQKIFFKTTQQTKESLAATGENAANIITTATEKTLQKLTS